ncbi:hypothetical protein [Halosimplex salinum]|uniref:hypothetical protein n=1 Tax=Halosimplex salinum TaxID=1710538 RepID=UPI000F488B71|nr:hypothetical protein [Halosimplex salinum]
MANGFVGALAVFVYFGLVFASPLVALLAWALSQRRDSFGTALGTVAAGSAGLIASVATAFLLFVSLGSALVFAVVALAATLVLAVFPVLIGQQLLDRWTLLNVDETLEYATLGWPVALVISLVLFVSPGGFGGSDVTALSGLAASVAWMTLVLVVTLGPALAGLGLYHLVERYA